MSSDVLNKLLRDGRETYTELVFSISEGVEPDAATISTTGWAADKKPCDLARDVTRATRRLQLANNVKRGDEMLKEWERLKREGATDMWELNRMRTTADNLRDLALQELVRTADPAIDRKAAAIQVKIDKQKRTIEDAQNWADHLPKCNEDIEGIELEIEKHEHMVKGAAAGSTVASELADLRLRLADRQSKRDTIALKQAAIEPATKRMAELEAEKERVLATKLDRRSISFFPEAPMQPANDVAVEDEDAEFAELLSPV